MDFESNTIRAKQEIDELLELAKRFQTPQQAPQQPPQQAPQGTPSPQAVQQLVMDGRQPGPDALSMLAQRYMGGMQ